MISVVWAAIVLVVALGQFMLENAMGMHENGQTLTNVTLALIVVPVAVVGSMVHARMANEHTRTWKQTAGVGALTALLASVTVVLAWVMIFWVLDPNFTDVLVENMRQNYISQGSSPKDALLLAEYARNVSFQPAIVCMINGAIALAVGATVAAIAAIGLKRKPLAA